MSLSFTAVHHLFFGVGRVNPSSSGESKDILNISKTNTWYISEFTLHLVGQQVGVIYWPTFENESLLRRRRLCMRTIENIWTSNM